jgi:hypothetical protein
MDCPSLGNSFFMQNSTRLLIPMLSFALGNGSASAGQIQPVIDRFSVDALVSMVSIADPQISPDGSSVAFVLSRANMSERRYDSEVASVDVKTREVSVFSSGLPGASLPRWSPSGKSIAFLATAARGKDEKSQIFVASKSGGTALQMTRVANGVQQFAWRPDGEAFAFVAPDDPPTKGQSNEVSRGFEVGNDSFLATFVALPSHIWTISSTGGEPKRLTAGDWSVVPGVAYQVLPPLSWNQDGSAIAFTRQATPHSGDSDKISVNIVDVRTRQVRPLTSRTVAEGYGMFSPDGSAIAYSYYRDGLFWTSVNDVFVAPATGGDGTNLSLSIDRDIQTFCWTANSRSLVLAAMDQVRAGAWLVPMDGPPKPIELGDLNLDGLFGLQIVTGKKGELAFAASAAAKPTELYFMASTDSTPLQLTTLNEPIVKLPLGRSEVIKWRTSDGWDGNGILTLPPGYSVKWLDEHMAVAQAGTQQ